MTLTNIYEQHGVSTGITEKLGYTYTEQSLCSSLVSFGC